jgi:CRP-like cAMP-binding protein
LNTIHSHPEDIRLTPSVVLQLHRDLFQFAPGGGGRWKSTDTDIMERHVDGTSVVRFRTVTAHLTADAMDRLHHDGKHSLVPWWEYIVGVMLIKAYREFEDRVGATGAKRGAKRDMIRDVVSRLPNEFRYADLERALPAVSRPTIARALRELAAEGLVRCVGRGRDATWEKIGAPR